MFNKRINKILAVNLALGLSFAGCNFKAVDTKPHGITRWIKLNPVKSVLISLAPFVAAVGGYSGYKFCKYLQNKDGKSGEIPGIIDFGLSQTNGEKISNTNKLGNKGNLTSEKTSDEKTYHISELKDEDFYKKNKVRYIKITEIRISREIAYSFSEENPRYGILKNKNVKGKELRIKISKGKNFLYKPNFNPEKYSDIDYIKTREKYYEAGLDYCYYLNEDDFNKIKTI
ncbi:MAG: hypothetical protein RsTaC01_0285 [Candidatus Paraimprobicoccus trichonymphae]|uniref:Lipoprotein n=1 Tax=Candidatus Paraimprobicoccus trichonymphae TaxID=3033793 RepID=A0AA48KZR3_9FIRM|nr:MAG: hypothetical protein RsTaC01_0285 [Candidatus Paraimprobicoccus trichonymphae]